MGLASEYYIEENSMRHKQSAFSLIEVLIALLILSIGVMAAAKMAIESSSCYRKAELHQSVTLLARSIMSALYSDVEGEAEFTRSEYWQTKLEKLYPSGRLAIKKVVEAEQWFYIITIQLDANDASLMVWKIGIEAVV